MPDAAPVALTSLSAAELDHLGADLDIHATLERLTRALREDADGSLRVSLWLWTPWSRLVDVELVLRMVRALDLGAACPGLLHARAPLPVGHPARARALAEGLLDEDDAAGESWRFADPTLAVLADALAGFSTHVDSLDRALELVESLQRAGPAADAAALLARPRPTRALGALTRELVDVALCERFEDVIQVAVEARLKPVRRPSIDHGDLDAVEAQVRARYGPRVHIVRTRHHPDEPGLDIAYGYTEAEVRELAALSARATSDQAPEDFEAVTLRIGELLGYPRCCVEAFLGLTGIESDVTERTLVARRLGLGALDPRWSLLLLVYDHYMPCSLTCAASLAKAEALERALERAGIEAPRGGWGSVVFFADLERRGCVAVLERGARTEAGFRYNLIALNHGDDALGPLLRGDELRFGVQTVSVLGAGELVHTYAGNAAVFDATHSWGDEAYLARHFEVLLAAEARARARERVAEADEDPPAIDEAPPEPAFFDAPPGPAEIEAAIDELAAPDVERIRCVAGRAGDSPVEWIAVTLGIGGTGPFSLTIVPRPLAAERSDGAWVGGVAPRFEPAAPLAIQRELAQALADRLDARASDRAGREVLERVLAITHPASGSFETFAGYAPCWPIVDASGLVHLALVARGRVLELLVAPSEGRGRWPGQAGSWAVAYLEHTPLSDARERAAFAALVSRLRARS